MCDIFDCGDTCVSAESRTQGFCKSRECTAAGLGDRCGRRLVEAAETGVSLCHQMLMGAGKTARAEPLPFSVSPSPLPLHGLCPSPPPVCPSQWGWSAATVVAPLLGLLLADSKRALVQVPIRNGNFISLQRPEVIWSANIFVTCFSIFVSHARKMDHKRTLMRRTDLNTAEAPKRVEPILIFLA